MNGNGNLNGHSPNGHHPDDHRHSGPHAHRKPASRSINPYLDAVEGGQPREIVDFEMDTDPYANMLPGISNIRAARTIARGVEQGKRGGHPAIVAVSVLLLIILVLPAVLMIVSQLVH